MNWRKPIYSNILRIKGSTMKYLAEYEKTQWYSSEQLEVYQREQLEKLLKHAANHVPYYRETMQEHGLIRNGNVLLDKFTDLPILTKDILRERFDELKSDDLNHRKWYRNTTGGSTGQPALFIQDDEYAEKGRAKIILGYRMAGKDIGQRELVLWGSERDLFEGNSGFRAKLANTVCNRVFFNSFKMSPSDMREYVERINSLRPKLFRGYAQSVYELARFSLKESLSIEPVGAVMTAAGTLYDFMRKVISEAFNASVFNNYGSRDAGYIAGECNVHLGLHVNMETHLVEIIDAEGNPCPPGQEGEIIVTPMTNYAMPLIRYRIGDMGVWADRECTCGRGARLLQAVTGRITDYFVTRSGRIVPSEYFIHLLGVVMNSGWVKKTQIIQEDYDHVIIRLVVYMHPSREVLEEIAGKIRLVMGQDCRVEFEFADEIAPSNSGKYRYTISKVRDSK